MSQAQFISIHAPRAGCDPGGLTDIYKQDDFNPRTPCGVRQVVLLIYSTCVIFQSTHPVRGATPWGRNWRPVPRISIHAPRAGCDDALAVRCVMAPGISIHAPRAGCDLRRPGDCHCKPDFNPRTPCGVRLESLLSLSIILPFQSTHPVRGATRKVHPADAYESISIHAPRAGCDSGYCSPIPAPGDFNPRTPCGVRRQI